MAGPLKNSKHENFAQAVFRGARAPEAYREHVTPTISATTVDSTASQLVNSPKVQARLAELKGMAADYTIITREMLVQRVLDTADDAKDKGVHSAAIRGYEILGRDKGVFQERKTVTVRSLAHLTEEELLDELAALDAANSGQAENSNTGRAGKAGNGKETPRRPGRVTH